MSRLSDLVAQAIIETDSATGERNIRDAASLVVERAGPEELDALAHEGARRLCATASKRLGPSAERAMQTAGQEELFPDLWRAYPVDAAGKMTKLTGNLSQVEFRRIIAIREKQIGDDAAHLRALRAAYEAMSPIWDENPDWTFEQCCEAYALHRDVA
jgi:hypothetical protein